MKQYMYEVGMGQGCYQGQCEGHDQGHRPWPFHWPWHWPDLDLGLYQITYHISLSN